jgi:hypothetical protein
MSGLKLFSYWGVTFHKPLIIAIDSFLRSESSLELQKAGSKAPPEVAGAPPAEA